MVRIEKFAEKIIPRALPTPGVDTTATQEVDIVKGAATVVGEIARRERDIADQSTATRLNRETTLAYVEQVNDIKNRLADDPQLMIQEIQKVGNKLYSDAAQNISSPTIRSKFEQEAQRSITSTSVANMQWAVKQQNARAKNDFEVARIANTKILGEAPDLISFKKGVREFTGTSEGQYRILYGDKATKNLAKDLSDSTERYLQNQIDLDPFTVYNNIQKGEFDAYIDTDTKQEWDTRAKAAINNFEKNLITKAKSQAVIRSSNLGLKVQEGTVKAQDVENEYNMVKDDKNVDEAYKTGLKEWSTQLYEHDKPSVVTQLENYELYNTRLTELQEAADKDPDKFFSDVLRFKTELINDFTKKRISEPDFGGLFQQALTVINEAAEDLDGKLSRAYRKGPSTEITNAKSAYKRFDSVLDDAFDKGGLSKDFPKATKGRMGVDMKINYQILLQAQKKRKQGKLTEKDYKHIENLAITSTYESFVNRKGSF